MLEQHVVDLAGRDLLSPAVDQLLDPPDQGQVTLLVADALVACPEPAPGEGLGVGLGVRLVAIHDVRTAHPDLAGRAGGKLVALAVQDGHLHAGGESHGAGRPLRRGQRVGGHLMRGLGHAVGVEYRRPQVVLEPSGQLRGERGAAGANESQRTPSRSGCRPISPPAQDQLVDGGNRGVPGHGVVVDQRPELEGVEALRHYHGAARSQRGERRGEQPVDVEERHQTEGDVFGTERVGGDDVVDRRRQVAVAQWNELGPAGRPAGVEHQGDLLRVGRRQVCRGRTVPGR